MDKYLIIMTTAPSKKEAVSILNALLKSKSVACVNMIDNIHSFFWWKGRIERANEVLMIIKTKNVNFDKVSRLIKKHHSYEVPEIVAYDIKKGSKDFLSWIDEVVR